MLLRDGSHCLKNNLQAKGFGLLTLTSFCDSSRMKQSVSRATYHHLNLDAEPFCACTHQCELEPHPFLSCHLRAFQASPGLTVLQQVSRRSHPTSAVSLHLTHALTPTYL